MVAINSTQGINQGYRLDGNAYWFTLSNQQIQLLMNGQPPRNARLGRLSEFLERI